MEERKDGDVIALRLVTGEYVCATYKTNLYPEIMMLADALIYEIVPGEKPRQFGVQFQPLIPLGSPGSVVPLRVQAVMFVMDEVHEHVLKSYRKVISPIVIPDKGTTIPQLRVT